MKQISLFLLTGLMALSPVFLTAQNNALNFDGTEDYVQTTYTNSVKTIEFWLNTNDLVKDHGLCSQRVASTYPPDEQAGEWNLHWGWNVGDEGKLRIYAYEADGIGIELLTNEVFETGEWYHIAITSSGSMVTYYVNGIFDSQHNYDVVLGGADNTQPFRFGGYYTNGNFWPFNGEMDEIRLWSDERTEAEIRQNMYRELPDPASEYNLIAYYKLNSSSGTTATDSKGSNDGTLTNMSGSEWQTSPALFGPKNCLDFDGANDYVEVSNLTLSGNSFTMEGWFYARSFNDAADANISNLLVGGIENTLIRIGDGGMDNNMPQFVVLISGSHYKLNANMRMNANEWYHLAAVYDGSEMRLYVNGELDDIFSQSGDIFTTTNPFILGGSGGGGRMFDGLMEEVRIWNTARTASQIRDNMCKNLTGNETNLEAYYAFDNTSGTTLQDFTGNDYDGTLTNMDNSDWAASTAFNTWLNTSSSSWSTASNWSRGSTPVSTESVGIYTYSEGTNAILSGTPIVGNLVLGSSAQMTLSSGFTVNNNLILENDLDLNGQTITMGISAYLIEDVGRIYGTSGQIQTTRALNNITSENVAGLGAEITTTANMGSTIISRTHAAETVPVSIKRRYTISPTNNTGLNATLVFHYKPIELNGLYESTLDLLRSIDGGANWTDEGGTVNGNANTITLASISTFSDWTAGGDATPILATSNPSQNYFSGSTAVIIAPAVTITSTQNITAATISISPVASGDVLSVSSLPSGLSFDWNNTTMVLTISGTGSASDYQTALSNIKFESTSTTSGTRTIDFNLGDGIGLLIDGQKHFYEVIGDGVSSINWTTAQTAALGSTYGGASGYLVTIMSEFENNYLKGKVTQDTWIGGSDAAAEGVWKWIDGPEAGIQFWSGGADGSTVEGNYAHWYTGEPNNYSSLEHYAHMRGSDLPDQWGYWNDYSNTTEVKYYITEYGGDGTIFTTMDDATVEVYTDLTWDGSESSDWNTATNWVQDLAPNAYLNVIIPDVSDKAGSAPIIGIDDEVTINNLTIDGGSLTINSTSSGTGSLIVNGTATGDIAVNRYVGGWSTNHGWHFLSSPVVSQDISTEFVDISGSISADLDFYRWSESEDLWINIKNESGTYNKGISETYFSNDDSPTFTTGKGYLIAYKDEQTKIFNGSLRTTDYDVTGLTYTSGKDYAGWHLLGNPFSCALDFSTESWDKSAGIGTYAQIWDETAASYKVLRTEQNIPAMNGFMVYTSSSDGSLTIPVDARIHSDSNWYKSNVNENMIVLTAIDNQTNTSQETLINFNSEATDGFDLRYDSYFIAGFAPMFYTSQYNKHYALNCFPELTEDLSVQLGFVKNNSTEFAIQLTESNYDLDIYITDTKLNETQNLSLNPVYLFSAFEQDDPNRFVIHFSPLSIEDPTSAKELIQIWSSYNSINIINTNNYLGDIKVLNMLGQTILSTKLNGEKNQKLSVNAPSGYYIINAMTQKGVVNKKLYLK